MAKNKQKGVSLAKGPVAIIGMALLAYGITALIFGGHSFRADPLSGTVNGKTWLGLEVNAWSSLLFTSAGALLLFGSPLHWAAKSMSLIVGLALGAAAVIALIDKQDVFGIFAANGLTKLVWGAAGALLIVLSLLPRVGGNKHKQDELQRGRAPRSERVAEPEPEPAREPVRFGRQDTESSKTGSRRASQSSVVAPASGSTPESQETTRRERQARGS
jgi:hypothetical protein